MHSQEFISEVVSAPKFSARFWRRVDRSEHKDCWPWIGRARPCGYAVLYHKRAGRDVEILVHRAAWSLVNGPIPDGMVICHACDNRVCCNPAHLFVGTHADNSRDMVEKGRSARGEKNRNNVLSAEQVLEIRALFGHMGCRRIAKLYNVSASCIFHIKRGRCWTHI